MEACSPSYTIAYLHTWKLLYFQPFILIFLHICIFSHIHGNLVAYSQTCIFAHFLFIYLQACILLFNFSLYMHNAAVLQLCSQGLFYVWLRFAVFKVLVLSLAKLWGGHTNLLSFLYFCILAFVYLQALLNVEQTNYF